MTRHGGSLRERWLSLRDRTLASPRFQRWAAGFPLFRGIARRRAARLFDLCAGFVYSQVLLACVRLQLFEFLRDGPRSIAALAAHADLSIDAMRRLADAAAALRLLEYRSADDVGLGPHGAALLGNPAVAAMIEHHPLLYADLRDPVALLRAPRTDTELARYWAYARADRPAALGGEQVAAYTELMSRSQPLVAADILDAYPLAAHRCLLDVGGGDGTFLAAAAQRTPGLRGILFDLPAVAARAEARFAAAGCADRVRAVGGDFRAQHLPAGADLVSLVRVIHDHDDAVVHALLRAAYEAMPAGGRILIAEPLADTAGAAGMGAAYFGFYLWAMGSGRPRTAREIRILLETAGFTRTRSLPTRQPLQTSLVVGERD